MKSSQTIQSGALPVIPLGNGEYMSPADCLQMLAFLSSEKSLDGKRRAFARNAMTGILQAAAAAGFRDGPLLESLLTSRVRTKRVWHLACEATTAVGSEDAFLDILKVAGITSGGGI